MSNCYDEIMKDIDNRIADLQNLRSAIERVKHLLSGTISESLQGSSADLPITLKPAADRTPQKRCKKCGEIKPLTEFYKNKLGRDGLDSACRTCKSIKNKLRYKQGSKKKADDSPIDLPPPIVTPKNDKPADPSRPYQCPHCPVAFRTRLVLTDHIAKMHTPKS